MTTLAADVAYTIQLGNINEFPVIASDIIYQGAAVGDNGSGYARPLVAGDPFRGFAEVQADNSTGSAGDINVKVYREGYIKLSISGLAITDVGKSVFASDDATFTLTSTSNSYIGRVDRWVSTGVGIVEFDASKGFGILASLTDNTGGTGNTTLADGLTATALTENGGAIGGTNNGDLPDLTATAATLAGTLTGTTDGTMADVAAIALSTGNTYTDAAVNTAVNTAITALNAELKELQVMVNKLTADNVALRASIREVATMTNTQTTDLTTQNNNDADLALAINTIAQQTK